MFRFFSYYLHLPYLLKNLSLATGELLQTIVNPAREAEKRKNPRADDKIKGRNCFWSGDGKYLYVPGNDEKSVLQYEFTGK